MIALLPSEIARLILNYLEEENLSKTYNTFLNECKYLEECKLYLQRGIIVPKTIHGKTLCEYLVINDNTTESTVKKKTTISSWTQTESMQTCSSSTETDHINNSEYSDQFKNQSAAANQLKRRLNESCQDQSLSMIENHLESNQIDQVSVTSVTSSIENYSPNSNLKSADQIECPNSNKKRKLLIGKNVEKIPELTVSSIERQLDSFINDTANYLKQQKNQQEQQQNKAQNEQQYKLIPINNNQLNMQAQQPQIIFDLVTGQNQLFTGSQPAPLVILPRNIDQPVLSRIQTINKEPIKSIQPIVLNSLPKVHLTNALNMSTTIENLNNYNTRSNRNKNPIIIPKSEDLKTNEDGPSKLLEAFKQTEQIPKKKKVYNRVTPTIRAIYEKNKELSSTNKEKADCLENKDVNDDIADIFDLPYVKSNANVKNEINKSSDSSDISLDDIVVKENDSKCSKKFKTKKGLNKSKDDSEEGDNDDDDLDKWFGDATKQANITPSRTLRSRTNSQRKF